jgi:hypothetical protein
MDAVAKRKHPFSALARNQTPAIHFIALPFYWLSYLGCYKHTKYIHTFFSLEIWYSNVTKTYKLQFKFCFSTTVFSK